MGKGGFGGECWNCGKKGHRSRDCEEPRRDGTGKGGATEDAPSLGAPNYKGNGNGGGFKGFKGSAWPMKGGGKGKGFQGKCWICQKVGHTAAECKGKGKGGKV